MSFDWSDFSVTASAIGTVAAALAAFLSWKTAKSTLILQRNSIIFEREKYVFDTLKAFAEKGSGYAKGKSGFEWSFYDGANIVRSLTFARKIIMQHCESSKENDFEDLKHYFVSQLNMELCDELHRGDGPDALFKSSDSSRLGEELYSQWKEAVNFFDIWHFPVATEDDLKD
ncbi:hypothetical protein V5037_05720 [Enterobacter ludwigii]|uniref:hypothetical protein n=1 Tax=Enterobacter ludwigii TaxID=299767 RepID=UPI000643D984|nr:hypothetical protein [Enterobacter ludwigii]KLP33454.1 hypothetical protein ABR36_23395 [Enterobacter ludwigii]